jgi:hypothetical protein
VWLPEFAMPVPAEEASPRNGISATPLLFTQAQFLPRPCNGLHADPGCTIQALSTPSPIRSDDLDTGVVATFEK